jgi:hypothetical protein
MSKAKDNPAQLTFTIFCAPTIVPNGDGYIVKPGKPLLKLGAGQVAAHFGVDRQSVYRWRQEGLIPDEMVHRGGKRKLMFVSGVIAHLEAWFRAHHE